MHRNRYGNQVLHGFADGQVEHLAIERGVIAGGAAETDDLTVVQAVFTRALRRVHHLRGVHIHDVQGYLGIGHLRLAAAEDAEQLAVAGFLAAELGDIAGDDVIGALEVLGLLVQLGFLGQLAHVVAVQHEKRLLCCRWVIRMVLAWPPRRSTPSEKMPRMIAGTVVELADGDRTARPLIRLLRTGHLGYWQTA
jgi:hypothetical protein